jgi:hypothetical protein
MEYEMQITRKSIFLDEGTRTPFLINSWITFCGCLAEGKAAGSETRNLKAHSGRGI